MGFRRFTLSIIFQSLLLTATGFLGSYLIFGLNHFAAGIFFFCLVVPQIFILVHTVNRIIRALTFFFDAVQNNDSSLKFPEKVGNKAFEALHRNLNRINSLISEIKIQNEYKEHFYHTLLEHSATGLISINEKGDFEVMSEKAKYFLGVKHTSSLHSLQNNKPELFSIFTDIKAGENRTIRLHVNNEILLLLIKASEIKYDNKKVKLVSLDNIKQELDENELDSWQKLISVLTHEIMNSIAPITSLSDTLLGLHMKNRNPVSTNDKVTKHTINGLEVIKERSDGLQSFVKNYRSLTKIPKPEFKPVAIREWTERLRILLSDKIKENAIDFQIQLHKSIKELVIDEKLFTQIMLNLVNNAVDALHDTPDRKIHLLIDRNQSGKIVLNVWDNGKGIPDDIMDKIFVPFYTTKEHGSGIGLSLSRQIIRLHGGSLSVYSSENEGTKFVISL